MSHNARAVTLIELLVCIILLSIVVLGLASIDTFSSFQVKNSERRAKLQYEVSIALDHMTKYISKAIGNEIINGNNKVVDTAIITNDKAIQVFTDYNGGNGNGQRDAVPADRWIAYRYTDSHIGPNSNFQIWYCPQCNSPEPNRCNTCNPAWGAAANPENIISRRITDFTVTKPGGNTLSENYVNVQITACWDTTKLATCGSATNPSVQMNASIKMPSVTTH